LWKPTTGRRDMCGIAGVVGDHLPSPERVEKTLQLMGKRGPDARGVYAGRLGNHQALLLHTRLSIIDLDVRSNQPFLRDGCALSFNGEIYNFIEVREELTRLGHTFTTTSDTEVIIEAYRRWGPDCVKRFEGMWAFALLDEQNNRLWLSRDRFGEKPLFYWQHEGALYFGSEVKFLVSLSGAKPTVNMTQLRRYLVNGYKALYKEPNTFFNEVVELPAAAQAVVQTPERVEPQTYWSLAYRPNGMSRDEAAEGVRERLFQAVKLRLRADVPVAFCLSGGVDSTALASIASKVYGQKIHAFSIIDKDERYHELDNMRAVVDDLGCEHHVVETSTEGFRERLCQQIEYHDAPVVTISYYMHAFLSQAIREHGFKVALSGSAADELFTGYYDHYSFWLAHMSTRAEFPKLLEDWRESYGAHVRNPLLKDPLNFVREPARRDHIYLNADVFGSLLTDNFREDFAEEAFTDDLLRNRMLNELFHEAVPVILKEDDLNSMLYSVENRSPYLDSGLAEYLYQVPGEYLIRDGYVKWLLREAVEGLLVDSVRLDKRKRGFNASIESLVDRSDPDTVDWLLQDSPIFDLVKRESIAHFLRNDMSDNSFSKFLFSFISAKTFLETQRDLVA
jgi:asparagine synthase (glutamine-hydrolysing)